MNIATNADTIAGRQLPRGRRKPVDVLWGAWVEDVKFAENSLDIKGIYENVWRKRRSDFPLILDLIAVVAYQAERSESHKTFKRTLQIIDIDGSLIFEINKRITLPEIIDTPYRWYEKHELPFVTIKEPHYYELSILINNEQKQVVPLWVLAPKTLIWNPEDDSTLEEWPDE